MKIMDNISKLFYKDYYEDEYIGYYRNIDLKTYLLKGDIKPKESKPQNNNATGDEKVLSVNDRIKRAQLHVIKEVDPIIGEALCSLKAKVLYPGIVTGVGLEHESKKLDGAYSLGMHFDYTTGMPIVYGSSVKGVLRAYFKEFYIDEYKDKEAAERLFQEIFNGKLPDGKSKSIYKRDIFFDAVIVKAYEKFNVILEDDAITPHTDGPLKEPKPISMLKIAPGCQIEFRFRLQDSDGLNKEQKKELFEKILSTVGVGAKTNIGYGQLEIIEKDKK